MSQRPLTDSQAMRILVVTNLFPTPLQPTRGAFARQQLVAASRNHAVEVIAPIAWTDAWAGRKRGTACSARLTPSSCSGLRVEHPRYWFPPRMLRRWYGHCFRSSIRAAFNCALAEFGPDVVYAPWAYPDGWAAVRLAHDAGLPAVVKVLGSDVLMLPERGGRRPGTIQALHEADRVIAVSQHLRHRILDLGVEADRLDVVYDGVNPALFRPGARDEARRKLGLKLQTPTLLFVGNLVPVKGPDVLVDSCAILAKRGQQIDCCLVGHGPMRPQLERRIAREGLSERVHLAGPKPHAELPEWYRAADLVVLPSRSEGVPNVLLEASASGRRFVASRVGGIPEVAGEGCNFLVPPEDPAALATAILQALAGPASCTPRPYEPQSWERSADVLIEVLTKARFSPDGQSPMTEPVSSTAS